jgi:glycine/D-amino acid oxidase-like deaminating enzyme
MRARGPTATAAPRASISPPWPPGAHGGTAFLPPPQGRACHALLVGYRGLPPDGLPAIGPCCTAPGIFHTFGFSASGFQLGPGVGVGVGVGIADLITQG